jgi:PTS system mannose-specific IID component
LSKQTDDRAVGALTRSERAGIFWRSLFLQAAWNPRGMQNVGFCFAMLSVFGRCGSGKEARRAFLTRHLGFFNTNPTLASYVLGAAAAGEVAGADESAVVSLKKGLSSPLGMAGDALLWGALRPLAATLAVLLALRGIEWAPLALVGVYGVPHLVLKVRGIGVGAAAGPTGAREVLGPGLKGAVRWIRALAAFGVGLILAGTVTDGRGAVELWRLVVMVLFAALAYAASRVRIPAMLVALGGAAGGVVLLLAGLNGG